MIVGLSLLAAAAAVVWRQGDAVFDPLQAMRRPAPGYVALLAAAVAGNLVMAGLTFSVLISRYGRVGVLEMQALTAATALLNFLPMRPGFVGRIAYHKHVNNIPVRHGLTVGVQAAVITAVIAAYLAGMLTVIRQFGPAGHGAPGGVWLGIIAPLLLLLLAASHPVLRVWCLAAACRYVDVLLWAVRYYAAFALLGVAMAPEDAAALACVSVIATMAPLFSNGLGLREWAVGLAVPFVGAATLEIGLAAELLTRAVEIIIVTAAGLMSITILAARRRALVV
jgi:hypothetical protein